MSLQKRFKSRYPKANFADFKTEDFFGKPNIFFHNKAGDEETAVFDDDGKDFRSSIYFSKEMKRQLGLAPGFPLELTHNPNPKLEIPAVPFNSETRESGALKDALVQQEIYVTPSDKFKIKFRDIFTDTVITHRSSHESRRWLAGPNFEYFPQQLNFAFFCATTGCGLSRRILFEDKMRDGKNDLTDSELILPPQVRSFFWFHVYFTVRRILFELGGVQNSLPLPGDSAFSQTENKYDIPSFERICAEFGISPNADFRFTRGSNHDLGSVFEYFTNSGYIKTPFKYPSKETKFEDEGGRASDGNLVPYIENTEARNQYEYFLCPVSHGLTSAGLSRINQSIESFCYAILGSQVDARSSISGSQGSAIETQRQFLSMVEDAIRNPDISKSVQRFQLAIESAKVRLDLAISPGLWLLPSKMVVNTESVVGYNNKLKKATSFMRIGVNSDLNIPVRRSAPKHNFGSGAVKLPHSGVETQETKETRVPKSDSEAGVKLRTKEKQVPKSDSDNKREASEAAGEASDSKAGAKLRTHCFNFARDQFECFDYCRRWVSLVSFQMNLSLLFGAFDLLLSRSDYARTNTGWLNFQKIIHPVFIFNESTIPSEGLWPEPSSELYEFATLRLFASFVYDFVAIKSPLNLTSLNKFEIPRGRHANR